MATPTIKKTQVGRGQILKEPQILPASGQQQSLPETPLEHTWVLYYDEKAIAGLQRDAYKTSLRKLGEFGSVNGFWRYYNHIDIANLPMNSNMRMFKKGIEPSWEDVANKEGGKWSFDVPSSLTSKEVWTITLLALIGETFTYSDQICGAVLSIRPKKCYTVSIWNKESSDPDLLKAGEDDITKIILGKLAEIKSQKITLQLRYQPHLQSVTWNNQPTPSSSSTTGSKPTDSKNASFSLSNSKNNNSSLSSSSDQVTLISKTTVYVLPPKIKNKAAKLSDSVSNLAMLKNAQGDATYIHAGKAEAISPSTRQALVNSSPAFPRLGDSKSSADEGHSFSRQLSSSSTINNNTGESGSRLHSLKIASAASSPNQQKKPSSLKIHSKSSSMNAFKDDDFLPSGRGNKDDGYEDDEESDNGFSTFDSFSRSSTERPSSSSSFQRSSSLINNASSAPTSNSSSKQAHPSSATSSSIPYSSSNRKMSAYDDDDDCSSDVETDDFSTISSSLDSRRELPPASIHHRPNRSSSSLERSSSLSPVSSSSNSSSLSLLSISGTIAHTRPENQDMLNINADQQYDHLQPIDDDNEFDDDDDDDDDMRSPLLQLDDRKPKRIAPALDLNLVSSWLDSSSSLTSPSSVSASMNALPIYTLTHSSSINNKAISQISPASSHPLASLSSNSTQRNILPASTLVSSSSHHLTRNLPRSSSFDSDISGTSPSHSPRSTTSSANFSRISDSFMFDSSQSSEWWSKRRYRKRGRPSTDKTLSKQSSSSAASSTSGLVSSSSHLAPSSSRSRRNIQTHATVPVISNQNLVAAVSPSLIVSDESCSDGSNDMVNSSNLATTCVSPRSHSTKKRKRPSRGGSRDKSRTSSSANTSSSTNGGSGANLAGSSNNNSSSIHKDMSSPELGSAFELEISPRSSTNMRNSNSYNNAISAPKFRQDTIRESSDSIGAIDIPVLVMTSSPRTSSTSLPTSPSSPPPRNLISSTSSSDDMAEFQPTSLSVSTESDVIIHDITSLSSTPSNAKKRNANKLDHNGEPVSEHTKSQHHRKRSRGKGSASRKSSLSTSSSSSSSSSHSPSESFEIVHHNTTPFSKTMSSSSADEAKKTGSELLQTLLKFGSYAIIVLLLISASYYLGTINALNGK